MKLSVAQITRAEDVRDLYQAAGAGAARLRLLSALGRELREQRDERGVWEVALRAAGEVYAARYGWVLGHQGRVLSGPDQPPPESVLLALQESDAPSKGMSPDTDAPRADGGLAGLVPGDGQAGFTRLRDGSVLQVPVCAGRQRLGTLVLGGEPGPRDPDASDLLTLEVLAGQVGTAAQLLRLSAELTRTSRQARHLRREEMSARASSLEPQSGLGGDLLTAREREVLTHVARGLSNPEIGAALGIRAGTAKIHVERILSKLGAPDRMGAATLGLSLGLIEP
jgi:DNA-binding NarL/FixJ family response regulator